MRALHGWENITNDILLIIESANVFESANLKGFGFLTKCKFKVHSLIHTRLLDGR
jgi:hypothetical protein